MLTAPWTGGGYPLRLRRIGGSVYLNAWVNSTEASSGPVVTVPPGFQPTVDVTYLMAWGSSPHNVLVSTSGAVNPALPQTALRWSLQWDAADQIPTSLPGTLITTAP
jgi:hypothetical protein